MYMYQPGTGSSCGAAKQARADMAKMEIRVPDVMFLIVLLLQMSLLANTYSQARQKPKRFARDAPGSVL